MQYNRYNVHTYSFCFVCYISIIMSWWIRVDYNRDGCQELTLRVCRILSWERKCVSESSMSAQLLSPSLGRRYNGLDGVSDHQPYHCLLIRLYRRRSKKISKLCVTGLCAGNSPVTSEFPAQMARNAENVSIWWRHHDRCLSRLDSGCHKVHAIL